jgi:ABC-type phosphate transport system substrate-binding protein
MRIFKRSAVATLALGLSTMPAMADTVAVVSSNSAIATLSKTQLADIFFGRTNHFPNGLSAVPVDQVEGSSTRDEFYVLIAGRSAAQVKAYWSKIIFTGRGRPPRTVQDGTAMKKLIHDDPAAIGYIDAKLVDDTLRVVALTGQ